MKKIAVFLKGEIENGEIFEQTPDDHPLLLVLGQSSIFPKMEQVLKDMQPGETKSIKLLPEEAYGPHHKDLVQTINISNFKNNIQPAPGMILSLSVEREGKQEKVPATVISVEDGTVTLDYNHPLAGKTVMYTMTLHKIMEE